MILRVTDISGRLFVAQSADCLRDGVDQVVCSIEIGTCSLHEEHVV